MTIYGATLYAHAREARSLDDKLGYRSEFDILPPLYAGWGWDYSMRAEDAAAILGRLTWRWTVCRTAYSADGRRVLHERISHHWTRRAAWLASCALRSAYHEETTQ